jgi:hypothetical protein
MDTFYLVLILTIVEVGLWWEVGPSIRTIKCMIKLSEEDENNCKRRPFVAARSVESSSDVL